MAGTLAGHGSLLQRGQQSFYELNYTSLFMSAAVNTESLKIGAKFLIAGGSAAISNGLITSVANFQKDGNPFHTVELKTRNQVIGYAGGIAWGMLFDQVKEGGAEKGTEKLLEKAVKVSAHASGKAVPALLRVVSKERVSVGLTVGLGTSFEMPKKWLEQWWEHQGEAESEPVAPRAQHGVIIPEKRN